MKKETNICDICSDRVAKRVCSICGKDMCIYCGKDWRILIKPGNEVLIPYCKKCLNGKIDNDILDDIKKVIIEKTKKGEMVNNLK